MGRIIAAGDIGSNTAHLLVAEVVKDRIHRISDTNEWLSLGEKVSQCGEIPPDLVTLLRRTLLAFKRLAHAHHAEGMYVFATEAVRKAKNGEKVLRYLKKETGLKVELISALQEATLGLRGALLDTEVEGPYLFCELGGGSLQVATCEHVWKDPVIRTEVSLPLGSGVLIERFGLRGRVASDTIVTLREHIMDVCASQVPTGMTRLLSCGGVARGMIRALHPDGDPVVYADELEYLATACSRLTEEEMCARFRIKPRRAGTLLPGALVFRTILDLAGLETMHVSQYGVREGAVLQIADAKISVCPL